MAVSGGVKTAPLPVAFAHKKRILRRELEPDNIPVGALGPACVPDFGSVRETGSDLTARTVAGASMGVYVANLPARL